MTISKSGSENLIVKVSGRLDTTTAPELEASLKESYDSANSLVLDFEELDYISSAGLRVLLQAQKTMGTKGGMVVKNAADTIKEIFDVTGFSDILTIE